jgi:hypothetical protein
MMDNDSKRTRPNKSSRETRSTPQRSGEVSYQLPHHPESHSQESPTNNENDLLNVILGEMTSDADDTRVPSTSSILSTRMTTNDDEDLSPPIHKCRPSFDAIPSIRTSILTTKPPRTSKHGRKPNRNKDGTYNSSNRSRNYDEKYDLATRRKSLGDLRREQLTQHMKDFYQDWFEIDQNSNINYIHDNLTNDDKRKQYSTSLW